MVYTYIFEGVKTEIGFPVLKDWSQAKIENRSNAVHCEFPDGLTLDFAYTPGQMVIYSNRELIQLPDGTYSAPEA